MRASRRGGPDGPASSRGRGRSRGSSSVEYGLLIAMIGAMLCVGLGIAVRTMFADTVNCMISAIQDNGSGTCSASENPDPGGGEDDTAGNDHVPQGTPTPTPCASGETPGPSDAPTCTTTSSGPPPP